MIKMIQSKEMMDCDNFFKAVLFKHRPILICAYLNDYCALGFAVLPQQPARYNPLAKYYKNI